MKVKPTRPNQERKHDMKEKITWKLIEEHTGKSVFKGEVLSDFRGDQDYVLDGGAPPHKVGSTGRVYVKSVEDSELERSFFPSVFGLKWVEIRTPFETDKFQDFKRYLDIEIGQLELMKDNLVLSGKQSEDLQKLIMNFSAIRASYVNMFLDDLTPGVDENLKPYKVPQFDPEGNVRDSSI